MGDGGSGFETVAPTQFFTKHEAPDFMKLIDPKLAPLLQCVKSDVYFIRSRYCEIFGDE